MLDQYFKDILKTFNSGDATEPSFYGDFKKLLENFSKSKGITLNITTQPKKIIAGIPDFVIRRSKELIGYIEAKDIGKNLEIVEDTEQIKKYKKDFDNFILTNYFDFWLWRKKEKKWIMKTSVSVGPTIALKTGQTPPLKNEGSFFNLLSTFLKFNIPERKTAKLLAQELAIKAKLIPQYIVDELNNDIDTEIDRIYSAFTKYLISDLSKEDFADIYAQTITYGLFMARLRHKGKGFNRFLAQQYIPKNIQILKDTFSLISGSSLPESISWVVDDIATILAYADIEKIKKELHHRTGGDDPLIHFYETFLKEYNPKEKKHRGIYYTPLPVVSYITRSINILLKEKFGKKEGFADKSVTILDPASGTLTFPANAILIAKKEIDKSPAAGSWLQIVKNHILKDYYAFELLMAPYIIGHLKISLLLEDLGYKFENNDRFPLYLTNTLDLSEVEQATMPFVAGLSEEAQKARKVKKDIPILVVMGNPPYSVSSSNIIKEESEFKKLYESYKETVRKEEKNIQPLSDDYIKFIAFAHWKINQLGQGIIGMITNNSYLDGLIHRDMRRRLAEDFDEIYILNLHGSSKRKEKTPEGGKDENVFDIQQGVGIILLVKTGKKQQPSKGKESNYFFPLYLCPTKNELNSWKEYLKKTFLPKGIEILNYQKVQKLYERFPKPLDRLPNFNCDTFEKLKNNYKKQISPEEIFYYIYGVLYSNIYRKKYNEFLKIDFPRIPFTKEKKLFNKISELGEELVNLHLLKSQKLENLNASFLIIGDNVVRKREYNEKERRIYMNEKQYFGKVDSEVWNYYIGGYQVLDKWLKDRIGKTLLREDVNHYLKMITSLRYTIDLQKEIDKIYPKIEKNLIER